jgi:hypothetical protein
MGATIAGGIPAHGSLHQLATPAMVAEAFFLAGKLDRAAIYLAGPQALAPSADLVAERQGVAFLAQGDIWTERYERGRLQHASALFSGLGAQPWLVHTMIELAASGVRADARNPTSPSAGHALSGPVSGGSRECRLGRMRGATRLHMTGRAGSRGRGEVRGPWSRTGR